MPSARTVCPICRQVVEEDDRLVAEWYEPCQWFVLKHYRQNDMFCGVANHPLVMDATHQLRQQMVPPSPEEGDDDVAENETLASA